MDIQLESFELTSYNKEKHQELLSDLAYGESYSGFIKEVAERLLGSQANIQRIFQRAFVVESFGAPIGYLYISSMVNDEVFLEYSIIKRFRGLGYGTQLISELTDYLFIEHNIRAIRLDVDPSNVNSTALAENCGYIVDEEEFASRGYKGRMQFVKESEYYISKRKNKM